MGPLDLVVDSLADVMQESADARYHDVGAELGREHASQVSHLDRMLKHVLAVGGPEVETSKEGHELRVKPHDTRLIAGLLAPLADDLGNFLPSFLDYFLYLGRLDAAISDKGFERNLGDVTAQGVEGGERDAVGRVVDKHVDASRTLEGLDIAAFLADNLALYL